LSPNSNRIFVNDMSGLWVQMFPQEPELKTQRTGPEPKSAHNQGSIKGRAAVNNGGETPNTGMGAVPLRGTPFSVIKNRFLSPLRIPCQKPPFGTLSVVDLKTRKIVW
jgi:quinate dehydrogenase (quinone)